MKKKDVYWSTTYKVSIFSGSGRVNYWSS